MSAHGTRDLKEVVKEIRDEFETTSGCGKEVSMLLEVGKLPYQARGTLFKGWILIIAVYFSIINCLGGFFFSLVMLYPLHIQLKEVLNYMLLMFSHV